MRLRTLPKILIPVIAILIVALFALAYFPLTSFIARMDESSKSHLAAIGLGADNDFELLKVGVGLQARALAYDGEVVSLVAKKNYAGLAQYFEEFQSPDKADYLIVIDTKGNILFTTLGEKYNGVNIGDLDAVQKGLVDEGYTEIGPLLDLPFAMFHGAGLYEDGLGANPIVASIICGYNLEDPKYVDTYKTQFGAETTIFNYDTRINTTVLDQNGQRALNTKASDAVIEAVLKKGQVYQAKVELFGQPFLGYYVPLKDGTGEIAGIFFTGLSTKSTQAAVRSSLITSVAIALAALALVGLVLFFIVRGIVKRMRTLAAAADLIAAGNLQSNVSRDGADELGDLAGGVRRMQDNIRLQVLDVQRLEHGDLTVDIVAHSDEDEMGIALSNMSSNLNKMFGEIYEASAHVFSATRQISAGSQSLASASTQQAAAVEQLTASVSGMAEKTNFNADMADKAANLAETIKRSAEKGTEQMTHMLQAVQEINEASNSINKVIKVIDDIAFQTNILALNAAVEAARAGQHGKGFAVVAEEVRSLAAKSAEAAKNTSGLIVNSIEKAQLGAKIAQETSGSLEDIVSGINDSSALVSKIARSSKEQSASIEEINKGITSVSSVIQQNSATAQQSAASATGMSEQADNLDRLMAQFKLRGQNGQRTLRASEPAYPATDEDGGDDLGKY